MVYIVIILIIFIGIVYLKRFVTQNSQKAEIWIYVHKKEILIVAVILGLLLFTEVTILTVACMAGYYVYSQYMLKKRLKLWEETNVQPLEYMALDKEIARFSEQLIMNDKNKQEYKFNASNLPYGRVNAFLNYFGRDIMNEEIYYFSAIPSINEDELREYGVVVTGSGIFIAYQKNKKKSKLKEILFSGLENVQYAPSTNMLTIGNIVRYGSGLKKTKISANETTLSVAWLANALNVIQQSTIPHVLFENKIVSEDDIREAVQEAEEKVGLDIKLGQVKKNMGNVGAFSASTERNKLYGEIKNEMNMPQGHGYGAEYGNKTVDRILGKKVVGTQEKINGHHAKDGADRIVNGQKIQVKYYKNASATYRAGFTNSEHDYSGQLREVPRDQYNDICKRLQKEINDGKIKGVEPGTPAEKYVKKGFFTYNQACNIVAAGTLESIGVDLANGVITSVPGASITAVIVFATAIWQGADVKEAAKASAITSMRVVGKSAIIYTITMQVNREYLWKFIPKSSANTINPLWKLSNTAAGKIANSSVAKSSFGQKIKLDKITGQKLTSGVVTVAVVFGPDVCKACMGKISVKQLAKNATVGAAGIAGAAVGTTVTAGNPLGGIVGGAVAGALTKKVADNFVEDDAIRMFRVLKEEFLDVVMSSYLTEEEFNEVASKTIFSKRVPKELQNMYKASKKGEERTYAYNLINDAVVEVLKKRSYITNEMWNEGQKLLVAG